MKHLIKSTKWTGLGIMFLVTFTFSAENIYGQNDSTLTFYNTIDQVLNDNQGFAAEQAGLQAKEKDITIARASFLPSFGIQASYYLAEGRKINDWDRLGVSTGTKGVLSGGVNQMIYHQGYFANHKIQKDLYTSQAEQLRSSRYQLIASAGQAYIAVLLAEELLKVMLNDREITRRNLDAAIYRAEIGSASEQEILRWRTSLYSADQNIANQKANIKVNRITLNQLRNQPEEQIDTLENLTIEKDGFIFTSTMVKNSIGDELKEQIIRDYFVEIGLGKSPLLGSFDAQISAQEMQLKSDKRFAIPNFDLVVGIDDQFLIVDEGNTPSNQSGADFWFVGATMSWPIISGGANFSKIQQQKIVAQEYQFQRKQLLTSQEQAIRSNVSMLIAEYQSVGLTQEQMQVANQNYELVYESYLTGEMTLLNLLDAQHQRFSAYMTAAVTYYTFLLDLLSVEQTISYFPFLQPQNEVDAIISELENRLL